MSKKKLIPAVVLMGFLFASIYATNVAVADEVGNYPPIVQKIADKFNLDVEDVNSVFEEEKQEMFKKKHELLSDRLGQAVADGKITEDQKNKILEKIENDMAERYSQREDHREEMQSWLKEQGIDPEVLRSYIGFGMKGHLRGYGKPIN